MVFKLGHAPVTKGHASKRNQRGIGGARMHRDRQVVANEQEAMRIAKLFLNKHFSGLITYAYRYATKGIKTKRFYPKDHKWAGRAYYEYVPDTATLRFLIERYLPPAKVSLDVNLKTGFEALIADLEKEELIEQARLANAIDVSKEWESEEDDKEKP